jgi:hypothetical protein
MRDMEKEPEFDPVTGEELDEGCIMRGTPGEDHLCQPWAKCPSCDQERRRRAKKLEDAEKQSSIGVTNDRG